MEINTDINKKTLRQWIQLGRVPNKDAKGEVMFTNGYRQFTARYFSESETHIGTKEELKEAKEPFLAPKRERERIRKRIERAKQKKAHLLAKALEAPLYPCINPTGIVAFKIETTGVNPSEDEILQFYACDGDGNTLLDTYIRPYIKDIWPGAEYLHQISPALVENAPFLHEIIPTLRSIFNSAKLLVTYNGYPDELFLHEIGINILNIQEFDVMIEFAPIYGDWDDLRGSYRWQQLSTCTDYYNYTLSDNNAKEHSLAALYCYKQIIDSK